MQVDGGSDNKARAFFAYCELLVKRGVFACVYVSFLPVGHTHADYDQAFVPITIALRKGMVRWVSDMIELFKKAYKTPPQCVEHVMQVHDWTKWLVKDNGLQFEGFARRTPDDDRPHQFIFERGEAARSCDGWYKRWSYELDVWNKKPFQLLHGVPEGQPQLQPTLITHLEGIAKKRTNVLQNFANESTMTCVFTVHDIEQYVRFFDLFSTNTGDLLPVADIEANMSAAHAAKAFRWIPEHVRPLQEAQQEESRGRGEEPILHANQTKIEQKKIKLAAKVARAGPSDLPQLARGVRTMSRMTQLRMSALEREMEERLQRAVTLVPQDAVGVIVGVDAPVDMEPQAMFHWTSPEWEGHDHEYEWLTMEQLQRDWSSLSDDLLYCDVGVTWRDTTHGRMKVYKGMLSDREAGSTWFKIDYEDGDVEWINLASLEVRAVAGSNLPGVTTERRVRWVLWDCRDKATAELPKHKSSASRSRAKDSSSSAESSSDSDMDLPLRVVAQKRGSKRAAAKQASRRITRQSKGTGEGQQTHRLVLPKKRKQAPRK